MPTMTPPTPTALLVGFQDLAPPRDMAPDVAIRTLVGALRTRSGLWLPWTHLGTGGPVARSRYRGEKELVERVLRGGVSLQTEAAAYLRSGEREVPSPALSLSVSPRSGGGWLLDMCRVVSPTEGGGTSTLALLDGFTALVGGLRGEFGPGTVIGGGLGAVSPSLPFPRPRPPRTYLRWTPGVIVGADCTEDWPADVPRPPGTAAFRVAPVPPGTRRTVQDGVVLDRWVGQPWDGNELQSQLGACEQWLGEVIPLPIAEGFNALGDTFVSGQGLEDAMPWMVSINPAERRGIKGVAPTGGELPVETVLEAMAHVKRGALPDGRPIERLDLLFPTREDAVGLRPAAKALGVARTLWVDTDRRMWNIHPLGSWWDGPSPLRVAQACVGLDGPTGEVLARVIGAAWRERDEETTLSRSLAALPAALQTRARYALGGGDAPP